MALCLINKDLGMISIGQGPIEILASITKPKGMTGCLGGKIKMCCKKLAPIIGPVKSSSFRFLSKWIFLFQFQPLILVSFVVVVVQLQLFPFPPQLTPTPAIPTSHP